MGLWSDPHAPARLGRAPSGAARAEAVERVQDWTRERFGLAPGDTIVVTQAAGKLPGFPPWETVVGFWTAEGVRHHYRVFKAVEDVAPADLPPAWMREALAWDGFDCDCC